VLIYEVSGPGLVDVLGLFFDGIPPRLGIRRALGGLD